MRMQYGLALVGGRVAGWQGGRVAGWQVGRGAGGQGPGGGGGTPLPNHFAVHTHTHTVHDVVWAPTQRGAARRVPLPQQRR